MKTLKYKNLLHLIFPVAILLVISILTLYGATFVSNMFKSHYIKQIIWIVISLICFFVILTLDTNFLKKISLYTYIVGIIFLFLVLIFGKEINGARAWFKIGSITIQPSELFKFFYLLFLSKITEKNETGNVLFLFKILLIAIVPILLIFLEPDTGVVIMYLFMTLGVICASNIKRKYLYILSGTILMLLVIFLVLYFFKTDLFIKIFGTSFFYRIDRLLMFANSNSYQLQNALTGIGSSGIFGHGITNSKIYIPEATTDFAFALAICNFGLTGGLLILYMYLLIFNYLIKTNANSKDKFSKSFISGVLYMMLSQVIVHILMNIGLAPITGITLPFLSYGGSSLISYFMLFAFILKITTNNSSYN